MYIHIIIIIIIIIIKALSVAQTLGVVVDVSGGRENSYFLECSHLVSFSTQIW